MAGSSLGTIFKITTWGESHGEALGVVVDGCPAGLSLSADDIQVYLDRRRPGRSAIATPRVEADRVEILSGVFEGFTTGTPISLLVRNTAQHSADYGEIATCYRPGHADYTFDAKYGIRDYRGGGRSSGRETIGRVAAGAIAAKILKELGIVVTAYTQAIGPVTIDPVAVVPLLGTHSLNGAALGEAVLRTIHSTATAMPDPDADRRAIDFLEECKRASDSAGGVIACLVTGMPPGIGEPVFGKLDASLTAAIMSIGAVKAVEIGDGIAVATALGSHNNDPFGKNGKGSNHAGGILGGISDGAEIVLRAYVKPTPSIFAPQETINTAGEAVTINIKGRHDPVIVPRAVVVVEAMTALVILDAMMINMSSRLSSIKDHYKNNLTF